MRFHRGNQDLNKVPGKICPSESPCSRGSTFSKVRKFRGWDLGAEYADWLSIHSDVFQPPFIRIISKIYCYCVMKCSVKIILGKNVVVFKLKSAVYL